MSDDINKIRVVVMPLPCDSETSRSSTCSDKRLSIPNCQESDLNINDIPLHKLSFSTLSENNNAKRNRTNSTARCNNEDQCPHTKCATMNDDNEDVVLLPKMIRTEDLGGNPDENDAPLRVHRSRSRDNLQFGGLVRTTLPPIRPSFSVGSMRLPGFIPHSTLQSHHDKQLQTLRRKTSKDILEELYRKGLLKQRPAGIAFDIPFPRYDDPQKPKPIFGPVQSLTRLTCGKNKFDAEAFIERLDQRQRTDAERRNKITSTIKERLGLQAKHLAYRTEECAIDDDYEQRTIPRRIVEKQTPFVTTKERQENEFRQRIREQRRRRDEIRKRTKRRKKKQKRSQIQNEHFSKIVANPDVVHSEDTPGDPHDAYEYSDEFDLPSP